MYPKTIIINRAGKSSVKKYSFLFFAFLFFNDGCAIKPHSPVLAPSQRIAAGRAHVCVVTDAGGLKCWGSNGKEQLGNITAKLFSLPVDVTGLAEGVHAVAAGEDHTCALLLSGKVKCWGANEKGQLGNGNNADSAVPVDVAGLHDVTAVAAGGRHTCALLSSGNVKCWGANDYGQLGDGTSNPNRLKPADVSGLAGATAITAGGLHSCAVMSAGSVKCWGLNYHGQLGAGTNIGPETCGLVGVAYACSTVPTETASLRDARMISAGGRHTCALLSKGNVKCWGDNWEGQLGHRGDIWIDTCGSGLLVSPCSASPVEVSASFTGARAIAAGKDHTCALLSKGNIKCWGGNSAGQLGNGSIKDSTLPVDVALQGRGTALAAGAFFTCALLSSGEIKCWGADDEMQLGSAAPKISSLCKKRACSEIPVLVKMH